MIPFNNKMEIKIIAVTIDEKLFTIHYNTGESSSYRLGNPIAILEPLAQVFGKSNEFQIQTPN